MSRIATAVIGTAALIGLLTPVQAAHADPTSLTVNKCSSGKIKYEGKIATGIGSCNKAPVPFLCVINKLEHKYDQIIRKLEKSPNNCLTTGDLASPAFQYFEWNDSIFRNEINPYQPLPITKCDKSKHQCVGKYIAGLAGCYAKAAGKAPGTVDAKCISKSEDKFSSGGKGCFDKAIAAADCSNPAGTADGLRSLADTFLITKVCTLNPGATPDCP